MRKIFFLTAICCYINATTQNTIVINADKAKDSINRNIYGHFAEHLGHCIYGGFYVGDNNTKIPNKNGVRLDVRVENVPAQLNPGFVVRLSFCDAMGCVSHQDAILSPDGTATFEVRGQESEVGSQKSEVDPPLSVRDRILNSTF